MTLFLFGLILVTVFLSACGQLALKLGVTAAGPAVVHSHGVIGAMTAYLLSPFVLLGLVIYGVSACMWIWVLSKTDLSVAYPFIGISFIVTMAFGAMILNESVTPLRIAGTLLIAVGCACVARSA